MTKKILVLRMSSIGDLLHCSAVPRHLKNHFPDSEIHWLVRSDMRHLIEGSPHISKIWALNRESGFRGLLEMAFTLRTQNFSHIYDAHNNLRSHLILFFLKAPHFIRRSKYRLKRLALFLFKIDLFPKPYRSVETYVSPLMKWGISYDGQGPEIPVSATARQKVKPYLDSKHQWIAIAPSTAWPKKTWPLNLWKEFLSLCLQKTSYHFVILGGPKDDFCQELVLDPSRCLNLAGRLSLSESAAALTFCRTIVAADTGLLHMGEAEGLDVVGIMGPTPFGMTNRVNSISLKSHLWCQPCSKDGRGLCYNFSYQKCLKLISPSQVFEAMNKVIGK
ncbi:MAG: glycosyltransferase family 9 protein [Oligoflexia bacterium]|nr:glycosyltransferase family 9 protein [Oligoflexia bacterium]